MSNVLENQLITETQYNALCNIGYPKYGLIECHDDFCDAIEDWLRRKHNIVIYACIEPFVDPRDNKTILYRYAVKKCDTNRGYNGRTLIGKSRLGKNPYALRRICINLAIKYIKTQCHMSNVVAK